MAERRLVKNRQWAIYGTKGAIQLKLAWTEYDDKRKDDIKHGEYVVFLEAATVLDPTTKKGDWENKISMALSISDLGLFLQGIKHDFVQNDRHGKPIAFMLWHDRHKGTSQEGQLVTTATLAKGKEYGYVFTITKKSKEGAEARSQNVMVPLSEWQLIVLEELFKAAIVLEGGFYND
jgi:hypothetical protein